MINRIEKNKVTFHFKDDRIERAEYISRTVGFGPVIASRWAKDDKGRFGLHELQDTGVIVIRGEEGEIVTMYIATFEQAVFICDGKMSGKMITKIHKNKTRGYLKRQPGNSKR